MNQNIPSKSIWQTGRDSKAGIQRTKYIKYVSEINQTYQICIRDKPNIYLHKMYFQADRQRHKSVSSSNPEKSSTSYSISRWVKVQ